tara:strand:- start:2963 stop:3430 length:468 start_codon:yes stop_codon:yes gene_type:complete
MARRFFSDRDVNTFSTINKSLMGDVIGSTCIVYKISSEETQINVYGESTGMGKIYNPGVKLDALIDSTDFDWNTDEFGPDAQQTVTFSFLRNNLIDKGNVVVEVGDIIEWNYAYFEVDVINENKLIGGNVDQNFDVVAETHMTRLSKLNIIERQR